MDQLDPLLSRVRRAFPKYRFEAVTARRDGLDCLAIEIDHDWIAKIPRHEAAAHRLRREAALLPLIAAAVPVAVPAPSYDDWQPPMTLHRMIPGVALTPALYALLSSPERNRLATDLARFHLGMHRMPFEGPRAFGAGEVPDLLPAAVIRARAMALLPAAMRPRAALVLREIDDLGPDPLGQVFGHYDAHGGNMAWDPDTRVLNGIFDFADAGFGDLHRDFVPAGFVSPDLSERLVAAYARESGLPVDPERVRLLTAAHRLSELAEATDLPDAIPGRIRSLAQWLNAMPNVPAARRG
ncbi:aminoglycoside phosphotransferase family protein [Frigidibacter sp. MR17.14]|uniref:aminoglycoside phosphotransferase family protein n=1 Tax=Frigidibacter sp. MR17.14 TaxID=3126509 RepID=UPI003012ECA6